MLFDAISAYFLAKILDLQFTIEPTGEKIEKETPPRFSFSGNWIAFIYLFNPMVITSCLSMELGVFERMWVLSAIYSSMTGDLVLSSLFLSLATQFGTYPLFLFPFIAMIVRKTNKMSALSSIPTIFILVVVWHVLFHLYFQQILGLDSLEVLKKTFWATYECFFLLNKWC
ncbi:hypothetical protein HMI55_001986 [Coelomomyces lativittatus]|nr:hypothetical protein HMI55_001986 [Coelomomyces lativittatus]KAJ1505216.1 hypothetical protein HMI56_001244 [Coelomomyces lativittatus]